MSSVLKSAQTTQHSVFSDIRQVAEEERCRIYGPPQEPVEVQMLRMQAADEAQQVIGEALMHAEALRAEARQEGYRSGFAEGFAAGKEAGMADAEAERAQLRAAIEAVVAQVEAERKRLWAEAETQIIGFALEMAQKVVKEDAQINREIAVSVIRNALRRVVDRESIRIRVNAQDLENIRAGRDDLLLFIDGIRHLEIVEDRRVGPGGCVVETNEGTIDARIETQFREIEKAMQAVEDEAA